MIDAPFSGALSSTAIQLFVYLERCKESAHLSLVEEGGQKEGQAGHGQLEEEEQEEQQACSVTGKQRLELYTKMEA